MTDEEYRHEAIRLRPMMLATAMRYIPGRDEGEDIVQEALLKMWILRNNLNIPVENFAKVLIRNLSIDRLRRQRHDEEITSDTPLQTDDTTHEQTERLMAAVATLPETWQIVLRLRHMQEMEYRDIADIMQTTETAVRKMISRARLAVRKQYIGK